MHFYVCVIIGVVEQVQSSAIVHPASGVGVEVWPGSDEAAQPVPDYEVDQRVSW